MARFAYQAKDTAGRPVTGELDAADPREAIRRLAARGWTVSALSGAGPAVVSKAADDTDHPALHRRTLFAPHPTAVAFTAGFLGLHRGGMPVGDAIRLMASRVSEPALRALCRGLWRDLSEGASLSAALARRPAVFDEVAVHLTAAGESAGKLVPVLTRLRESYAARATLKSKVTGAIGYPVFITVLAMAVMTLFVFVIMPRMQLMMDAMGGKFPVHVRLVMTSAELAVKLAPLFAVAGLLAIGRWRNARRLAEEKRRQDARLLKIPVAGRIIIHLEATGLAELLGTLAGSGVNAAEALKLAEEPIGNTALRARFAEARRRVNDGAPISVALGETGIFEPEDIDLMAVGESTGTLAEAFSAAAERHRAALDAAITKAIRILTGGFLALAVGLVFFCLVSIMTTILSVSQSVLHR